MRILQPYECENVRADRVEYGDHIEHVVAKRSVGCRCCAQTIKKGEQAIKFFWDFDSCGSWTASVAYMHEACEPASEEVAARINTDHYARAAYKLYEKYADKADNASRDRLIKEYQRQANSYLSRYNKMADQLGAAWRSEFEADKQG